MYYERSDTLILFLLWFQARGEDCDSVCVCVCACVTGVLLNMMYMYIRVCVHV